MSFDEINKLPLWDDLSFKHVRRGDIIRHKSSAESYVVTDTQGDKITAVRSISVSNETEWVRLNRQYLDNKEMTENDFN